MSPPGPIIEHMFAVVEDLIGRLRCFNTSFDFASVTPQDSVELYERLVELERLADAAKNLAARQMAECGGWHSSGYRSPSHLMADRQATGVNQAAFMLATVEEMQRFPGITTAYRNGALNDRQAVEIVSAAAADPGAEQYLLAEAEYQDWQEFKRRCVRVREAALDDEQRQRRAHRRRQLSTWVDSEGAFRISGRFTTAAGAHIMAGLEPYRQKVADRASRRGRRGKTSPQAALADALVEMARHAGARCEDPLRPGPATTVHVRVDHAALTRGHTMSGEICEVPGVGPLPVSAVKQWMEQGDACITALLVDGEDIRKVVKVGSRHIPARLKAALVERDSSCVVPGCGQTLDLQIDHVIPVHRGGPTTLYNLARLCSWHHYLKTTFGYVLKRRLGHWLFEDPGGVPPDLDDLQQQLSQVGYLAELPRPG